MELINKALGEKHKIHYKRKTSEGREYEQYLCTVDGNPFGNCQIYAIAHFHSIITCPNPRKVLLFAHKFGYSKNILIVDIKTSLVEKAIKIVGTKRTILSRTDYISTNGSNMTQLLIKTRGFCKLKIPADE